jgi:phosphoribosylaminoimidazole carboxylase PurE protein
MRAERRGIRVLIAGAGGAAALPGFLASLTSLPIIGVPINSSPLNGLDALLSIAQMPKGVPVATVAVGKWGAANAGILAAQILALSDARVRKRLAAFRKAMAAEVQQRSRRVVAQLKKRQ